MAVFCLIMTVLVLAVGRVCYILLQSCKIKYAQSVFLLPKPHADKRKLCYTKFQLKAVIGFQRKLFESIEDVKMVSDAFTVPWGIKTSGIT